MITGNTYYYKKYILLQEIHRLRVSENRELRVLTRQGLEAWQTFHRQYLILEPIFQAYRQTIRTSMGRVFCSSVACDCGARAQLKFLFFCKINTFSCFTDVNAVWVLFVAVLLEPSGAIPGVGFSLFIDVYAFSVLWVVGGLLGRAGFGVSSCFCLRDFPRPPRASWDLGLPDLPGASWVFVGASRGEVS